MSIPKPLNEALEQFAARDRLLVCLDFDGCVAELVADANAARPVPENAAVIEELAKLDDVVIAYVSGRPLETLRELASPPEGTLLFGSHGAERWLGPGSPGLELTPAQEAGRSEILETLEGIAADHDGAWVEHKPAGGAIHVRHIEDIELGERILDEARSAMATIDGASAKDGKQILEAVVVKSTKGEAIQELRTATSPDAVFFAGDDITDEHGFAVLDPQDVGIKVGPGETKAGYRIDAPPALAEVLSRLAALRG